MRTPSKPDAAERLIAAVESLAAAIARLEFAHPSTRYRLRWPRITRSGPEMLN